MKYTMNDVRERLPTLGESERENNISGAFHMGWISNVIRTADAAKVENFFAPIWRFVV